MRLPALHPGFDGLWWPQNVVTVALKTMRFGKILLVGSLLLGAAQAVEHYEISRYGTLRTWAEELGLDDAVKLLQETLDEEKATDESLTELAESEINPAAITSEGESEDEDEEAPAKGKRRVS